MNVSACLGCDEYFVLCCVHQLCTHTRQQFFKIYLFIRLIFNFFPFCVFCSRLACILCVSCYHFVFVLVILDLVLSVPGQTLAGQYVSAIIRFVDLDIKT